MFVIQNADVVDALLFIVSDELVRHALLSYTAEFTLNV